MKNVDTQLSKEKIRLLQHTLGADSRTLKKNWGYRNRFLTGKGSSDYEAIEGLVADKYMGSYKVSLSPDNVYYATEKGMIAIGFKPYQIRNANRP